MAIVQNIDLNLIPDSEAVVVKVNQYDDGTGRIQAHLYLNDTAYTPASGATVRIEGTKPDKHGFSYTASISGNTVTADLTTQMTAVAGRTRAQIIVEEPSGKTGTFAFWLDVQAAALADETDISETEIPAIIDLARQNAAIASAAAESAAASATTAQTAAQGVEEFAEDSEAYAVGKRGGTNVPSTDPTYHNNSKYYAGQAGTAAQSAQASAEAAAVWSEHPPYIGANGNWCIYDTTTHAFVDSGIDASITVQIADVTMLDPTAAPYVTNTGSNTDPIFHLFLPRGQTGAPGQDGEDGVDGQDGVGIASIVKTGSQTVSGRVVDTYTITYTDNTTTTYQVVNGKDGEDGQGSGDMLKATYDPNNNQYPLNVMTGATSQAIGTVGLVPLPRIGDQDKFLRGDGSWADANSNDESVYIAEYGVTSYADIDAAYIAGKYILVSRSLNGTTMYALSDKTSDGTYYFRSFSNSSNTNYGCYIAPNGTWAVNSYSYATLASPAFTGTPTAPTAAAGTNTKQIATTAFVADAMTNTAKGVNSNLATIETTTTASQAYAVRDYLVYGGQLYKVTTAIASGGTIVVTGSGANVAATTVSENLGTTGGVTGVKGNSESSYRTGDVNLTLANLGAGDAASKAVTDSTSASAIGTGTSLVTERDVYYGLPSINGSHSYNSGNTFYAPTSAGTSGYLLESNGSGAPRWASKTIPSITYSSTDLTPGSSSLTTGTYYFVYE